MQPGMIVRCRGDETGRRGLTIYNLNHSARVWVVFEGLEEYVILTEEQLEEVGFENPVADTKKCGECAFLYQIGLGRYKCGKSGFNRTYFMKFAESKRIPTGIFPDCQISS